MTNQNEPADASGTASGSSGPLSYARRVVALLFGILIVVIAVRFLLLALGANSGNGLVDFFYSVSEPFVDVFRGVFSFDHMSPIGRSVIDVAALVAILGYGLLAILIVAILRLGERERATA